MTGAPGPPIRSEAGNGPGRRASSAAADAGFEDRIGVDGGAAAGVDLEVQVRTDGVAGVTDVADHLPAATGVPTPTPLAKAPRWA